MCKTKYTTQAERPVNEMVNCLYDILRATLIDSCQARQYRMRILHILDHSIPLHSGYTFRTLSILEQQRALGWETYHLTSP